MGFRDIKKTAKPDRPGKRHKKVIDEQNETHVVPSDISRKILREAQKQMEEDGEMIGEAMMDDAASVISLDVDLDVDEKDFEQDDEGFVVTDQVDPAEEAAMAAFLQGGSESAKPQQHTLADIILKKIADKEKLADSVAVGSGSVGDAAALANGPQGLPDNVVKAYREIGHWMSHYKTGKIPKAFKIIPHLSNWEEVLYLTNPLDWSPNAMLVATKLFASSTNSKMAQRFFNLVLLPAVREDIYNNNRLNFHYYFALRKAFYKPAAWFKGILIPLAESNCTVREAVIVSSILSKTSIPVLHASAALVKLATMNPWYVTTSIFMGALIRKKYSFPYKVVTILVDHFCNFTNDFRTLPLVWHLAMLGFVQRYKYDITDPAKERFKKLMKAHTHQITEEIRRELFQAPPKELRAAADAMDIS